MNANNQPYDLDVIDPIVVKEYRSPFRWIIPFVLGCLAVVLLLQDSGYRGPHSTNVWLDYSNPADPSSMPIIGFLVALVALISAICFKRWLLALVIIFATGYAFLVPIANSAKESDLSHLDRIESELSLYKAAVANHTKYGVQLDERMNGRTLTYWCWLQKSPSRMAEGVIYDPANRLGEGKEKDAFMAVFKDDISRVEEIEPHWYYLKLY